jgi:MFS family permease
MFTRNYAQLFAARAVIGLGEAGYGSVGAALIASLFPSRLRGGLLAAFFAAGSLGSVLGVLLGGVIAAKWGWQAAFGVVGIPGLVLALLYLKVRDYKTVALDPQRAAAATSTGGAVRFAAKALMRSRTMLWVCCGGAAQLIVVSAIWSWPPSFLNRVHGVPASQSGTKAAIVVLLGAVGAVVWGAVIDRAGTKRARRKLHTMAALCIAALLILVSAFAGSTTAGAQFALIALGGFVMTCSIGPVSAIVIDVIHPGVRATGASVLALFQNLFGLAVGPLVTGMLSDAIGLEAALAAVPLFGALAAVFFMLAARSYENDIHQVENIHVDADAVDAPVRPAAA